MATRSNFRSAAVVIIFSAVAFGASLLPPTADAAPNPSKPVPVCKVDPKHKKQQDQEDSEKPHPWKRNGAKQVVVHFADGKLNAEYKTHVAYGAKQWSRSNCLEVKVVDSCSGKSYCVPVIFKASSTGDGRYQSSSSNGYMKKGTLSLDQKELAKSNKQYRRGVVVHEMGHAVGLEHRKSEKAVMYASSDGIVKPDKVDFQNLRAMYGNQK